MPSISIPTAVMIAGGAAAAGGAASAYIGSQAAKSAARTQATAATLASNNQLKMFEENKALLSPFVSAGTASLESAKALMGLPGANGGVPDSAGIQKALEATPGYQFTKQQGQESVQNSFAAQGLGTSGAALKGAGQFVTGLANQTYEARLADYLGLAGSGQNAAAATAGLGATATARASDYATSGAAATAAGTIGSANAITGGLNSALSGISQATLLGSLSGGTNPLSLGSKAPANVDSLVSGTALNPSAALKAGPGATASGSW